MQMNSASNNLLPYGVASNFDVLSAFMKQYSRKFEGQSEHHNKERWKADEELQNQGGAIESKVA